MTKQNLKDILQGVVSKVDTAKQDAIPTYTQQEYEAVKDTIPVGTIFNIKDDPVVGAGNASVPPMASAIIYDNTVSGLDVNNVQDAVDYIHNEIANNAELLDTLKYVIGSTPLFNLTATGKWGTFTISDDILKLKIFEKFSDSTMNMVNSWIIDVASLPTYPEYAKIGKNRLNNDINMAKSGSTIYLSEANATDYTPLYAYKYI